MIVKRKTIPYKSYIKEALSDMDVRNNYTFEEKKLILEAIRKNSIVDEEIYEIDYINSDLIYNDPEYLYRNIIIDSSDSSDFIYLIGHIKNDTELIEECKTGKEYLDKIIWKYHSTNYIKIMDNIILSLYYKFHY